MMEFTKEEQVQAIYDLKVGYALCHADIAMLKSMARQLLASMKQEPVAEISQAQEYDLEGNLRHQRDIDYYQDAIDKLPVGAKLYAAPQLPQPVEPEITSEELDDEKIIARLREMNSRPGSQQVMIAEPVSQPYTLRDGWVAVPVDMAPEQIRAVQLNSELGAYAAANLAGAYSLFREFWNVAIAAAPQQEVK